MKRRKTLIQSKRDILIEFISKLSITIIIWSTVIVSIFLISNLQIQNAIKNKIYQDTENVPAERVAIVFGAGLHQNSSPSDVLKDRILTAADLYKKGKVEKIIMSGDNRFIDYSEPDVMIEYAISQGVDPEDLQPDYAGRRTYDTCYRAKHIFGVDEAILVTQEFHLKRALYICNELGIESIGVASDLSTYPDIKLYKFRDFLALNLAVIDIRYRQPEVVLGEKIEF